MPATRKKKVQKRQKPRGAKARSRLTHARIERLLSEALDGADELDAKLKRLFELSGSSASLRLT